MTGTKIVKLKLEGDGGTEKLPKLMDYAKDRQVMVALEAYRRVKKSGATEDVYAKVLENVKDLDVTPRKLQIILTELEKEFADEEDLVYGGKAGLLLSALIQSSKHKTFHLSPLKRLDNLGFKLPEGKKLILDDAEYWNLGHAMMGGKVVVRGNGGDYLGLGMKAGEILVEGGTNSGAGYHMHGGTITVEGDSGIQTGYLMQGGTLKVRGSAGLELGARMMGGRIEVGGDAKDNVGVDMEAGEIEVKGNAGHWTGHEMKGGTITIGKNVGEGTGRHARNGEIRVGGKIGGISKDHGATKIYEGGEQVR
ncbi:MAG: hypothetical protein V1921_06660 [Candidatus Altiarchaeota archaeon]